MSSSISGQRFLQAFEGEDVHLAKGEKKGMDTYNNRVSQWAATFTGRGVAVEISGKTVVVNKNDLEKFMHRHGQGAFKYNKEKPEQVGELLMKAIPALRADRAGTIKMLARAGAIETKGPLTGQFVFGTIKAKPAQMREFFNALKSAGVVFRKDLEAEVMDKKHVGEDGFITLPEHAVKNLKEWAEKLLDTIPASGSFKTEVDKKHIPAMKFTAQENSGRLHELHSKDPHAAKRADADDAKLILGKLVGWDQAIDQGPKADTKFITLTAFLKDISRQGVGNTDDEQKTFMQLIHKAGYHVTNGEVHSH